jgi:uncharacterized membrane protein (UPF0127 family)
MNGADVAMAEIADTWRLRLRGLLGRRELPEALVLRPGNSVHGIGMRVSLDVALLDADGRVLRTIVLRPWAMTAPRRGAVAVLEAPVGSFARWGLGVGALVELVDEAAPAGHPGPVGHVDRAQG